MHRDQLAQLSKHFACYQSSRAQLECQAKINPAGSFPCCRGCRLHSTQCSDFHSVKMQRTLSLQSHLAKVAARATCSSAIARRGLAVPAGGKEAEVCDLSCLGISLSAAQTAFIREMCLAPSSRAGSNLVYSVLSKKLLLQWTRRNWLNPVC